MNIDIKFINENTVEVVASLGWSGQRPPQHLKESRTTDDVIDAFKKKHPSYEIESVEAAGGINRIFNSKSENLSRNSWVFKVSKKQKKTLSKSSIKKNLLKRTTKQGD